MIGKLRHGIRRQPAILIGCALALLFYLVGAFDVWHWAEMPLGDLFQSRRMKVPEAPDNIVLVAVDQSTLDTHGSGSWPLSRLAYATVLQALGTRGVTGVGFEMPLTEQDPAMAAFDAAFARQVPKLPAVVMAAAGLQSGGETNRPANLPTLSAGGTSLDSLVDHPGLLLPNRVLVSEARLGLNNLPRGLGMAVRSMPLLFRCGDALVPSFFLQCLLAHEGVAAGDVSLERSGHIEIRRRGEVLHRIPVDSSWRMVLPLREQRPEPARVGLDALVLAAEQEAASVPGASRPAFDLSKLRGRFVLVGREAAETYEPVLTARGEMSPAGVFLLAWQTVFAKDFIVAVPAWGLWLCCAPLAVFLVWFAWRFNWVWAILMACFVAVDFWVLSYWMLSEFRVWLFAFPPSLLCVVAVALGRWLKRAGPHREGLLATPPAKGFSQGPAPYPPGWSGPP